jgi:hypothetical protein
MKIASATAMCTYGPMVERGVKGFRIYEEGTEKNERKEGK